jgi:nickel/cobalt exporter
VKRLVFVACAVALGILVAPASPAAAHPLGNFSINQYAGLTLRPDRVDVSAVVDAAEIPTLQERPSVDANHDGMVDDAERAAHARAACRELAGAFEARVGRDRLTWTVGALAFAYVAGSTGLQTSRLTCSLTAPARLGSATAVTVTNRFRADRVGWREMTAVGDGVKLVDPPLPGHSVSEELRAYPADLLSSALDVRTATLRTRPGAGAAGATGAAVPRGGDPVTRWMAGAERHFQQMAGGRLTPVVAALAVLLAVLLGAGHAALPGHGKTVLAAYLAGKRGRARDAVVVGATVTLTHTGGVLVVGLLLSTSSMFAGDRLMGYLGIASGALVTAVGVGMLVNVRRRRSPHSHSDAPVAELALVGAPGAGHSHDHSHDRSHDHSHDHGHSHSHGAGPGHHHHHHGTSRWGLAGIGVAGGLVPSPSALVVLLGAIGLGRAGFGVLLVLAYGLGMAGALTGAGLLLVFAQRKVSAAAGWSRLLRRLSPLTARVPAAASTLTAGLVVIVGLGLAVRAAAGIL